MRTVLYLTARFQLVLNEKNNVRLNVCCDPQKAHVTAPAMQVCLKNQTLSTNNAV